MVEVLDRPKLESATNSRWHDENVGLFRREVVKLDSNGEPMAHAGRRIEATSGFAASVEAWDEIRKQVTRYAQFSYTNFTVSKPNGHNGWAEARKPKPWPDGTSDAIILSPNGNLPRNQ